jgi:hypothetical protein
MQLLLMEKSYFKKIVWLQSILKNMETNLTYCIYWEWKVNQWVTSHLTYIRRHLDGEGVVKVGSYVKEHILVGKNDALWRRFFSEWNYYRKLYMDKRPSYRDTSLRVTPWNWKVASLMRVLSLLQTEDSSLKVLLQAGCLYAQIRKIQVETSGIDMETKELFPHCLNKICITCTRWNSCGECIFNP